MRDFEHHDARNVLLEARSMGCASLAPAQRYLLFSPYAPHKLHPSSVLGPLDFEAQGLYHTSLHSLNLLPNSYVGNCALANTQVLMRMKFFAGRREINSA
jgi:hypothetical protein